MVIIEYQLMLLTIQWETTTLLISMESMELIFLLTEMNRNDADPLRRPGKEFHAIISVTGSWGRQSELVPVQLLG